MILFRSTLPAAHVTKDMIGLDAIDHLELTNKRWESVEITKPILGVEIDKLRKLNPANLKLWGIKFEKTTNVKFQCKKRDRESGCNNTHS